MNHVHALAALSLLLALPASAAPNYPFVGKWNCEVATFTFTNTTYNNGSENLRIKRVKKTGGNYELFFAKGYRIGLSSVSATSMSWLSGETGDMFECKRVGK